MFAKFRAFLLAIAAIATVFVVSKSALMSNLQQFPNLVGGVETTTYAENAQVRSVVQPTYPPELLGTPPRAAVAEKAAQMQILTCIEDKVFGEFTKVEDHFVNNARFTLVKMVNTTLPSQTGGKAEVPPVAIEV